MLCEQSPRLDGLPVHRCSTFGPARRCLASKTAEADAKLIQDLADANDDEDVAKAYYDSDKRINDAETAYREKIAKIEAELKHDLEVAFKKLGY